jgi:hypothetical protein
MSGVHFAYVLSLVIDWLRMDENGVVCLVGHAGVALYLSGFHHLLPDCILKLLDDLCRGEMSVQVIMQMTSILAVGRSHPGSNVTFTSHLKISPPGKRAHPRCGASMTRYAGRRSQVWFGLVGIVRVVPHELQVTLGVRIYVHGAAIPLCMSAV